VKKKMMRNLSCVGVVVVLTIALSVGPDSRAFAALDGSTRWPAQ